jgi:hypothetical protein
MLTWNHVVFHELNLGQHTDTYRRVCTVLFYYHDRNVVTCLGTFIFTTLPSRLRPMLVRRPRWNLSRFSETPPMPHFFDASHLVLQSSNSVQSRLL